MNTKLWNLAAKWQRDEKQYRSQVEEARKAGTPWSGMMARADQLKICANELVKIIEKETE